LVPLPSSIMTKKRTKEALLSVIAVQRSLKPSSELKPYYGQGFDARNLLGSWLSTGNALELLASAA
jgi:hypothetical protein